MRNVLKKFMGVKFHISFGCCGRSKGVFWAPKIEISSKMTKLAGYNEIDLVIIFTMDDFFCAILNFGDMINFVFFFCT